jgi:raffinose/stachyose/melibiose transport system substrate-binding protein
MSEQDGHDQVSSTDQYGRSEFLRRAGATVVGASVGLGALRAAAPAFGGAAASKTLTTWYLTGSPTELQYITALSNQFGKKHGLKTSVTPYDFDPMNRALKLALSAHRGPDVAYGNPSPDDQFVYQKNKWIINLSPYAKQYGWASRQSSSVTNYWNDQCCKSQLTGIPFDLAAVGWFYNPAIFAKYGVTPPTTYAELLSMVKTFKSKGVTPISVGGLNIANPGTMAYVLEQFVHALVNRKTLLKLVSRDPSASWVTGGMVQAMTYAQQWIKAGYLEPNALATSGSDADALFLNGQAAMTINGTWRTADYLKGAGDFTPRFFNMPRMNRRIPWAMGGYTPNNQWMISSFAKDKATAASYVDFMLGEQAARVLWNNGDIPAYKFKKLPPIKSKLQGDIYAAMQKTQTGVYMNTVGGFFSTQWKAVLEQLFNGSLTPMQAAKQLDANYKKTLQGG